MKNTANIEKTRHLFCFIFNNRRKNKLCLEITNFVKKKIVLIDFFT